MNQSARWYSAFVLSVAMGVGLLMAVFQVRMAMLLIFSVIFVALYFRISTAILVFFAVMPFLGLIRRWLLFYVGTVHVDPILLLPDLMIAIIFLRTLLVHRVKILGMLRTNRVLQVYTVFAVYLLLQCFNPAQGGVVVGLTGIKFYILPMLWVYVGLCQPTGEFKTIMKVIAGVGLIASAYGFWQYYVGLPTFDRHWIETVDFASLGMFGKIRTFSIFNAPEEYSRFLQVAFLAVMAFFPQSLMLLGLVASAVVFLALYQSGVRGSLIAAVFSVLSVPLWRIRAASSRVRYLGLLMLFIVTVYAVLPSFKSFQTFVAQPDVSLQTHVAGALNPLQQSTVKFRFEIWSQVLRHAFLEKPFGVGTGVMTPAGSKFSDMAGQSLSGNYESYFFGVLFTTGLIGAVLLALFWGLLFVHLLRNFRARDRESLWAVCIFGGLILNSVFGNVPMMYAVAPIYYYFLGYLLRQAQA